MRLWRRVRRFAETVALASFSVSSAHAAFSFNDESWEGTSQFLAIARDELGSERTALVAQLNFDELSPRDGILILHPEVAVNYEEVSAFLRAGGRVAIVDDFGRGAELLERFQIHRIRAPLNPVQALRHNPSLAIAVPAVQNIEGQEQGRHPIASQVKELVTNHPTALSHPDLTTILTIPARGEPDATIAVTGIIVDRGRLFAMSDPSAFINLMLRYPGNRNFALGLIRYLVEDDSWGEREGKLYLLTNDFEQSGHYGGRKTVVDQLSSEVRNLKEATLEIRRKGLPELLAALLAALAGVLSVGFVAWIASRPYRRELPRYAREAPLATQGGVAGRAAALGAKTSHRALAVLELKSALVDGLCHQLGLAPETNLRQLLNEVARNDLLSRPSLRALQETLTYMNTVEDAVIGASPFRIGQARLKSVHATVMRLLKEVKASPGRNP